MNFFRKTDKVAAADAGRGGDAAAATTAAEGDVTTSNAAAAETMTVATCKDVRLAMPPLLLLLNRGAMVHPL